MKKRKPTIARQIAQLQGKDICSRGPKQRYISAKKKAAIRGIPWELTMADYAVLVEKPCTYCRETKHESGVGLDRIDNALGYVPGNVVPCCYLCNMMRGVLPREFFLEQVRKIVKTG